MGDPRLQLAREVCPSSPLDLGVARWVKILADNGVETYESCEGGEGHAYTEPSVRFHGSWAAGWHALSICYDHAIPVLNLSRVWSINSGEPAGPTWQIIFRHRDEL